MRDLIYKFLLEAGKPVEAETILLSVLKIRSPNSLAADRVLHSILHGDRRFQASHGCWRLRLLPAAGPPQPELESISCLCLEQGRAAAKSRCFRGALLAGKSGTLWEFDLSPGTPTPDIRALKPMIEAEGNTTLAAWTPSELRSWNRLLGLWHVPPWGGGFLALRDLAARALDRPAAKLAFENVAAPLGLAVPDSDSPVRKVRFLASCIPPLLNHVPAEHRSGLAAILAWSDEIRQVADFRRFAFGRDFLAKLPETPGVYLMKNRSGEIIYVGKSRRLKQRVSSYFAARGRRDPKTSRILEQLYSIETVECISEVEALILEMRMIKDFRPAINLQADVHEDPSVYGKEKNVLLITPRPEGWQADIYLLAEGAFAGRLAARLGRTATKALRKKVRSVYKPARRRKRSVSESWERELVFRWFAANRRKLNFVDVDDAGGPEAALLLLDNFLSDPDRLTHKVYYR
jgi:hypothetical protein